MPFKKYNIQFLVTLMVVATFWSCTRSSEKNDLSNTVRLSVSAKIKGLDPAYANDLYSGTQISYAYEGLLQYHYLKRPYQLVPNLAESMPKVSNDGKTITFKIKKGVLFQDDPSFKETKGKGRELVAEDFVYSFKRLADPKLSSTGWWIFDGKIAGLNEWREAVKKADNADYSKEVSGLKALDRYTLRIKLTKRSSQFLFYLAMPFTFAVAKEAAEFHGKDFIRNPVGTGPFKLVRDETNLNSKLVWVKNPTYRKELYPSEGEKGDKEKGYLDDAGKTLPLSDKVVVTVFVESQPQWLNFLSGKLDASSIPKDNFEQAITPDKSLSKDLTDKGIRLMKEPSLDITHTSFNMMDPLLGKNKLLRQAMSVGYDVAPFIELFYNGRAIPAVGPIPPGLSGYDNGAENPYRKYSIDKAKKLLAKAGYPNGKGLPEMEYASLASSTSRQMSEYFVKAMAKLGVKVKVSTYSWPEFQNVVDNHKGQLWSFAWGADYPDAENFLQLFYSKNIAPGPNDSNYQNKAFDRLYDRSLKLVPGKQRASLYKKMAKIVMEDSPWIWGVHRVGYALTYDWLKNYKLHEFAHDKAKYYRVDTELRNNSGKK